MSLWNWIRTQLTGVDLEAEQRRRAELEAWEQALDQEALRRQVWSDQEWQTVQAQRAGQEFTGATDFAAEVNQAFREGAAEGLASMQRGVRESLTGAATFSLRAVLGFIPWWAWVLAAIWAAWQLGLIQPWLGRLRARPGA
ncbi:MAG: hypothetical protein N2378_12375 [Chloroflexaceae bacterium]|nr:hypothetical protein [Chloroflexaceae bacterium]